jgi:uncharacterized protein (UPF0332 family)
LKPETRKFLDKAQSDVADAKKIAAIELANVAARTAYYGAFHAAEGFIFERTGKVAKTHSGVRSEFARLTKDSPEFGKALAAFLGEAYKFKEMSDYSVDQNQSVTIDEAARAIANAERFVASIVALLEGQN